MLNIKFQKQKIMRSVLYALIPAAIGSVYFFGLRSLAIILVSIITCILTEWLFLRKQGAKVSEAILVTAVLYALSLPPTIPFFMVIIGAVFGVSFAKLAFGGFGMNVFNPAMVCRAFVYITFPIQLTNVWIPAANFSDFPGGFTMWRFFSGSDYLSAVTSATPNIAFKDGAATIPSYLKLFLGNINGQYEKLGELTLIGGGSMGETSALLLLIGGLYIFYKKVANRKLVISFLATYAIFSGIMHLIFPDQVSNPLISLLAGGAILGGFFIVTDPVSSPRTDTARWIYGALIAMLTVIIKSFSLFAGGLTFGVLLGNMFGPIIDHVVRNIKKRRQTA